VIEATRFQRVVGTESVPAGLRVLERAGIPHQVVLGAGDVAAVKWERVWVEAYLPYANYRGALISGEGKFWVPLDPGLKELSPPSGLDIVEELGFDPRGFLDEYLGSAAGETPLERARARVEELLATGRPDLALEDVLNRRLTVPQSLGILPASLPFATEAVTERSDVVPEELRHGVHVVAETTGGAVILDHELKTADVLGQRVTVGWVAATAEDEAVAESCTSLRPTSWR
jgi:hypothetical protein